MTSNPINEVELAELQGIVPEYINKKFDQNGGTDDRAGEIVSLIQAYRNSDHGIDWLKEQVNKCRFSHNSLAEMDEGSDLDCVTDVDHNNKIELDIKIKPKFPASFIRAAEESKTFQITSQLRSLGIRL